MRVLVIGARRFIQNKLSSYNIEAELIIDKEKAKPEDSNSFYKNIFIINNLNSDLALELAIIRHKVEPFDLVLSYTDPYNEVACKIAEVIEVPCNIDKEFSALCINKYNTRQVITDAGLGGIAFDKVTDVAKLSEVVERIGFPLIIKPNNGEGSVGVLKVENKTELEPVLQSIASAENSAEIIVEEFIEGEEFSVETISNNGQHYVAAITRKFKCEHNFVESGHVVPANLTAEIKNDISEYVVKVLEVMGLKNGPAHTEVILSPKGPKLIETHARLGGDRIPDLIEYSSGFDISELTLKQSINKAQAEEFIPPTENNKFASISYATQDVPEAFILESFSGVEEQLKKDYIHQVEVLNPIGKPGKKVVSTFERTAMLIAEGDTEQQAVARAREGIASISFKYNYQHKT